MAIFQGWGAMSSHAGMGSLATRERKQFIESEKQQIGSMAKANSKESTLWHHPQSLPGAVGGMGLGSAWCLALNPGPNPTSPVQYKGWTPGCLRLLADKDLLCIPRCLGMPTFSLFPSWTAQSFTCFSSSRRSIWCCISFPSADSSRTPLARTCRLIGCVTEMSLTY